MLHCADLIYFDDYQDSVILKSVSNFLFATGKQIYNVNYFFAIANNIT